MIEMMDDDVFYFEWCCSSVLFVVHHQKEERTAPVVWPESSKCNHPLVLLFYITNEEAMHQAETATTTREGGVLSHYALLKIEMN